MRTRRGAAVAAAVVLGLGVAGCGADSPKLSVRGGYVPQPVTADMAGGYFTVRNAGGAADTLTSVTSSISPEVQLHRTVHDRMERVRTLPVPAHGELRLGRGGTHLMLTRLKRKPLRGETVPVVLHFATSKPLKVKLPVRATTYMPDGDMGGGGMDGMAGMQ